jgi:ABC-type lipoprotein export system ATPase subunit
MIDENSHDSQFIAAVNLSKTYAISGVETPALRGLNLTINQGQLAAIVGPSGSGKSTLLNILGGLDRPSKGQLTVGGVDLAALPEENLSRYRREAVGFVWQQTSRNMLPYITVRQNVLLPMKLRGVGYRERNRRADTLLAAVDIGHRANHQVQALSGGEQQRAAIAVALANRPGLLLADEPTGSVDTHTTAELVSLFQQLVRQFGLTVVIVTHDLEVSAHVDRVIRIQDGRVVE